MMQRMKLAPNSVTKSYYFIFIVRARTYPNFLLTLTCSRDADFSINTVSYEVRSINTITFDLPGHEGPPQKECTIQAGDTTCRGLCTCATCMCTRTYSHSVVCPTELLLFLSTWAYWTVEVGYTETIKCYLCR